MLPLGQGGSVAQPLDLLRLSVQRRLVGRAADRPGLHEGVEFGGGKCLEERRHRFGIDRIGRDVLAHRNAVLLAKVIANVAAAALVLDDHLVAARAAIDDSVQEGGALARHAARLVPAILCVIVVQHGLDSLEGFPADIGRVLVPHDDPLSSDAKRNTPCRFAIGLFDQDLRECCHARLFASAG